MRPYYEDESCAIYNADCFELLEAGASFDVAFADPPYGVGLAYGEAYQDDGGERYEEWLRSLHGLLMASAPLVLVTPGIRNLWAWPKPTWVLNWQKPGSTRRSDLGGFNEWEPVLMYGKKRIHNDSKRLPDCVNHASDTGDHPCPKPLKLLTWLLGAVAEPGQTVLDPFLGSGTTLVAAKSLGLKGVGIEVEERYCEIAAKRLSQGVLDFGAAVGDYRGEHT